MKFRKDEERRRRIGAFRKLCGLALALVLMLSTGMSEYVKAADGTLYFYGWQEDKYYLYTYDPKKDKVAKKQHQDSKDAAIAYLETVASDLDEIILKPSFLREDINAYAGKYDITEPAFLDLYKIHENIGIIQGSYPNPDAFSYILEYQQGKNKL